jgi:hypothetical protein
MPCRAICNFLLSSVFLQLFARKKKTERVSALWIEMRLGLAKIVIDEPRFSLPRLDSKFSAKTALSSVFAGKRCYVSIPTSKMST